LELARAFFSGKIVKHRIMSVKRLPLFVYGTLVPGHGFANFRRTLEHRCHLFPPGSDTSEADPANPEYTIARAKGWQIFHLAGFPGSKPSSNTKDEVVGALVWPHGIDDVDEEKYMETIRMSDQLEKFYGVIGDQANEYQRIEIETTQTNGEIVNAWIYECLLDTSGAPRVETGDWPNYMKENDLKDAGEDWSDLNAERARE
jgi:gamma-glutamylcyclotransferase (GGCT)/AIG2-like uncharacterized protein YtfP